MSVGMELRGVAVGRGGVREGVTVGGGVAETAAATDDEV